MSDNKPSKEDQPVTDGPEDAATTDASFDTVPPGPGEASPGKARRTFRLNAIVGWLALLVALPASFGSAYLYSTRGSADAESAAARASVTALSDSVEATRSALAESRAAVGELQSRIDRLVDADTAHSRSLAELEQRFADRLSQMGSMPARMNNLEETMSSLQGVSAGVRDTWLLREAEYYMQIANAQLQLAGNPGLATLALKLADERVRNLADPALTEVRRALSDELRALETMDKPDLEGIVLTLASLAGVVDALPMRQELAPPPAETGDIDPDLSGMDRALASLRRTLGDIVSVRRTDEALQPLIAPEAQFFLRANLSLQLQAARLALLQSNQALFEQSLDDVSDWLHRYYDAESEQVRGALATIAEIRVSSFAVAVPDISGSLRLLRQFMALSAARQSEDAAAAGDEPLQ